MLITTMSKRIETIRDDILTQALQAVPFDGWTARVLEQAALDAGHEKAMAEAVFPGGVADALDHFADRADRQMLEKLGKIDPDKLRVRERIRAAVLARFEALQPHREAE